MSGTYHYHYVAVVWNEDDFSDIHILNRKLSLWTKSPILFDSSRQAKDYANEKGFKNCDTVALFHSKM